jgi:hypothetical protein
MKTIRRLLLTTSLAAAACGVASADSITVTCTGGTASSPTELNATISCAGLAGSGILPSEITGIQLEIFGSVDNPPSTISLTNNTASTQSGYAYTDSEFSVTGVPAGVTLPTDGIGTFGVLAGTCSPLTSKCVTLGSGASETLNVSGDANTGPLSVAAADFAAYEAAISFGVTTSTSLVANFNGGNVTVNQVTDDNLSATVVYDYTIPNTGTPEPTTMALMGGALIGLGLIGKKRFKKS